MEIHSRIAALRARLGEERARGRRIALVPTMGNLHAGHLALMAEARRQADCVVASIFVNRLQFAPNEDFERYPRTFESDCEQLRSAGVELLFAPDERELYPSAQTCFVDPPPPLGQMLEGEFRPGFFRGVATVVLKLFAIVQPDAAVFGKKDYQQLAVIRAMAEQFALPLAIVAADTVRAPDGLALSSRNGYLSAAERLRAPRLQAVLADMALALRGGQRDYPSLEQAGRAKLLADQWSIDYIAVRKQADLQSPAAEERRLVILAAARLGTIRLIDNIEVSL